MSAFDKLSTKENYTDLESAIITFAYHERRARGDDEHPAAAKAATELLQLQDEHKFMSEQIDKLNAPMPCGHLARYAVNGEEGTQYCALCVLETDKQTIANLENFIRTRNVVCTWCGFKVVYDNENEEEKQAARDAVNVHALVCEKDPRTVELETIKKASQNLVNELPLKVLVQDLKSIDALLDLLKPKETHHE